METTIIRPSFSQTHFDATASWRRSFDAPGRYLLQGKELASKAWGTPAMQRRKRGEEILRRFQDIPGSQAFATHFKALGMRPASWRRSFDAPATSPIEPVRGDFDPTTSPTPAVPGSKHGPSHSPPSLKPKHTSEKLSKTNSITVALNTWPCMRSR
jgi:hypothetical protein